MSRWKQWVKEPKGALPGGIVTKVGIALIAVLVAGLLFSSSLAGPDEDAGVTGAPTEPRSGSRDGSADDRESGPPGGGGAAEPDGTGGGRTTGMGSAEFELREALRLEEIERRTRSLRSFPVAQSHRGPGEAGNGDTRPAGDAGDPVLIEDALAGTLDSFERSLAVLEGEIAAGLAAEALSPGEPAAVERPSTGEPGRWVRPADPPGRERIHEGSFLEAVLVTQLSGEFPGPVLAMVSAPLYSADRQRVLIPRGSRVVGTARAVQNRDQNRLAVGFHRLLLPDGSWIDLEFTGLNQVGESGLRDQVNRHYLSTFAAAGAVGALSGLTLAGASPYGLRAGVGQGLGGSATSMLDRYLNRLPEITIRAGHRLRIWFTADVLVPTPSRTPHR